MRPGGRWAAMVCHGLPNRTVAGQSGYYSACPIDLFLFALRFCIWEGCIFTAGGGGPRRALVGSCRLHHPGRINETSLGGWWSCLPSRQSFLEITAPHLPRNPRLSRLEPRGCSRRPPPATSPSLLPSRLHSLVWTCLLLFVWLCRWTRAFFSESVITPYYREGSGIKEAGQPAPPPTLGNVYIALSACLSASFLEQSASSLLFMRSTEHYSTPRNKNVSLSPAERPGERGTMAHRPRRFGFVRAPVPNRDQGPPARSHLKEVG